MRRANIQTGFARRADRKILERSFQLETTPADVFLMPADNFDFCIARESRACLIRSFPAHLHFAGENHGSGFFGGFRKAMFNEKQIESLRNWLWLHSGPKVRFCAEPDILRSPEGARRVRRRAKAHQ